MIKRTQPRQALSPSTGDRIERGLLACLRALTPPVSNRAQVAFVRRRLRELVAMVRRSERR